MVSPYRFAASKTGEWLSMSPVKAMVAVLLCGVGVGVGVGVGTGVGVGVGVGTGAMVVFWVCTSWTHAFTAVMKSNATNACKIIDFS